MRTDHAPAEEARVLSFIFAYFQGRSVFILDNQRKLGIWVLTALVVGNMVGSGIFMLPRSLAEAASPIGVMLAWLLTGAGVLMTALVFGDLAIRKPDLGGGPQIYAKELFPKGSNLSILS